MDAGICFENIIAWTEHNEDFFSKDMLSNLKQAFHEKISSILHTAMKRALRFRFLCFCGEF